MKKLKELSTRYKIMTWLTVMSFATTIATAVKATTMIGICVCATLVVVSIVLIIIKACIKSKLKSTFEEHLVKTVTDYISTKGNREVWFNIIPRGKNFKYTIKVYDEYADGGIKELKELVKKLAKENGVNVRIKCKQLTLDDCLAEIFA